jgi:hypothetical protein
VAQAELVDEKALTQKAIEAKVGIEEKLKFFKRKYVKVRT